MKLTNVRDRTCANYENQRGGPGEHEPRHAGGAADTIEPNGRSERVIVPDCVRC